MVRRIDTPKSNQRRKAAHQPKLYSFILNLQVALPDFVSQLSSLHADKSVALSADDNNKFNVPALAVSRYLPQTNFQDWLSALLPTISHLVVAYLTLK